MKYFYYISSDEYAKGLAEHGDKAYNFFPKRNNHPKMFSEPEFNIIFTEANQITWCVCTKITSVFDKCPLPWQANNLILADTNGTEIVHFGTSGSNKFTPYEREAIVKLIVQTVNKLNEGD